MPALHKRLYQSCCIYNCSHPPEMWYGMYCHCYIHTIIFDCCRFDCLDFHWWFQWSSVHFLPRIIQDIHFALMWHFPSKPSFVLLFPFLWLGFPVPWFLHQNREWMLLPLPLLILRIVLFFLISSFFSSHA